MNANQRIQHIDAWRFIAVSLVVLGHLLVHSNLSFLIEAYPFLRRLARLGTFGVLIFFFIGGFVICRGLIHEQRKSTLISLRAFYVRRTFRIMPPLWLYLGLLAILASTGIISMDGSQLANSALFLCNMPLSCSWYGGHLWSLAYEEQFYIFFPLLFVLAGLIARPRVAILILFSTIVTSVALRIGGGLW